MNDVIEFLRISAIRWLACSALCKGLGTRVEAISNRCKKLITRRFLERNAPSKASLELLQCDVSSYDLTFEGV